MLHYKSMILSIRKTLMLFSWASVYFMKCFFSIEIYEYFQTLIIQLMENYSTKSNPALVLLNRDKFSITDLYRVDENIKY